MGSSQSSPVHAEESSYQSSHAVGGRGRKTSSSTSFHLNNKPQSAPHGLTGSVCSAASSEFFKQVLAHAVADHTEEASSSYENYFSDEEEEAITDDNDGDEQLELERKLALEDYRRLKLLAQFFLHPEIPVVSEGQGRCYFDRASAPDVDPTYDVEETAAVLRDATALKQSAIEYLHPELPVVTTDPCACGRNFFGRPSAAGCDDIDHVERDAVLADAKALKARAVDYMHPETPVVTTDSTACARCFFDRPSGPEPVEYPNEREAAMEEARVLQVLATNFHHPEYPVLTSEATATARCFFGRPSAVEQVSPDENDERSLILAELASLKKLAVDYMHPEFPVVSDPTAFARCYFGRASAVDQLSTGESDEVANIMADVVALKKSAMDYRHPELAVQTDSFSTARCYFSRPSAPDQLTSEDAEERERILRDAATLKEQAVDFHHPELPVVTRDPMCTARCFFSRASAVPQVSKEELEERLAMLADVKALKQLAVEFMHPELPVVTTDSTAKARCFYSRFSANEQESAEEMDERASILADAMYLNNRAVDYLHPEHPVVTSNPTVTARCFFDRLSAPETESTDDDHYRLQVLADARALKALAVDFMHPEVSVTTTSPYACGRNFYDRPAATYHGRMIHTFPAHDHADHDDDNLHEHMDHFGMEDFHLDDVGVGKMVAIAPSGKVDFSKVDFKTILVDEMEGNLSRSPSSVMLFQED